jgi:hypothetical protein
MAHAEVSNGCGARAVAASAATAKGSAEAREASSVEFHAPTLARLVPKRLDVSDITLQMVTEEKAELDAAIKNLLKPGQ